MSSFIQTFDAVSQGFLLCIGMIIVIGPQNMFLLKQGLRGRYLFVTVLVSTLVEALLIAVGVGGVGGVMSAQSTLLAALTNGGACFLMWCGVRSLRAAKRTPNGTPLVSATATPLGMTATVLAALSFSLLNPATYLDTLVIVGSKSALVPVDYRLFFGLGAVMASSVWFFMLTYGASRLSPLVRHPAAGRTLDAISGCIMIGVAGTMVATMYMPI